MCQLFILSKLKKQAIKANPERLTNYVDYSISRKMYGNKDAESIRLIDLG
jgi:hypothetical protein